MSTVSIVEGGFQLVPHLVENLRISEPFKVGVGGGVVEQ